jgi:hypothetical protein
MEYYVWDCMVWKVRHLSGGSQKITFYYIVVRRICELFPFNIHAETLNSIYVSKMAMETKPMAVLLFLARSTIENKNGKNTFQNVESIWKVPLPSSEYFRIDCIHFLNFFMCWSIMTVICFIWFQVKLLMNAPLQLKKDY